MLMSHKKAKPIQESAEPASMGELASSVPSDKGGGLTLYVLVAAFVAAQAGLIFGYDLGVTGGVISFPEFEKKFFPEVIGQQGGGQGVTYCQYDNQALQLFTSSLYLAGIFSTLVGGYTSRRLGRKATILIAGACFIVGIALCAAAVQMGMLIIGRTMIGLGVGFGNQAVPVFLSEMAPPSYRGALNNMFQLATSSGILIAQIVNFAVKDIGPFQWRVSLAVAGAPALVLFFGMLLLPDTPNSLAERDRPDQARRVLERIRGTSRVDYEMESIITAVEKGSKAGNAWRLLFSAKLRPALVVSASVAFFSQINGINAILFFAPLIFKSLGAGQSSSLLGAVAIGAAMVLGTLAAIMVVDRAGRRQLLIIGGMQMVLTELAVGILLAAGLQGQSLPEAVGVAIIVMFCLFALGFAWSWGPMGWLIPSEVQPLETRSVGQSVATAVNFLVAFIIGQSFLSTLCAMRWGAFVFYAAFVALAVVSVLLFIPETKGVPIERMTEVWESHWLWRRVGQQGAHMERPSLDPNGNLLSRGQG